MKKYFYLLGLAIMSGGYATEVNSNSAAFYSLKTPTPKQNKKPTAKTKPAPAKKPSSVAPTATKILAYADTGVGSPYVWGGSTWSTTDRKILGADCSGFTQKAWAYPQALETDEALPSDTRLTTKEFVKAQDAGYPWKRLDKISLSLAQGGDAMAYRDDDGGHIFLVSETDDSGVVTLEAKGVKYGIGYSRRSYASLRNAGYKILRRN